MVLLEGFRKMVLVLFLLATALTVGCAAGQPPLVAPVNTSSEQETSAEQPPLALPESESGEQETTAEQPPSVPEQSSGTATEHSPAKQEKPLVIVSENFVLNDSGQLLQALDKEMETLLELLEKMDDIQDEDFNY